MLILLNVVALSAETVDSVRLKYGESLRFFEVFSILVFTIEYVLRIWVCTFHEGFQGRFKGRLKYVLTPLALIDLLAILPFYLPFLNLDLRFIRIIRLFRLFRLAKIARYSSAIRTLGRVTRRKADELLITAFILVVLLIVASSLIYYAEHKVQPDVFPNIPASMWWGVATLTTVGYGDVYPMTAAGKIIGSIIAILGIGMFALPTGILGAGFMEEIQRKKNSASRCPHCGKIIE